MKIDPLVTWLVAPIAARGCPMARCLTHAKSELKAVSPWRQAYDSCSIRAPGCSPRSKDGAASARETPLGWPAPGHTLQTADIVNEAYLKLVNLQETGWRDRIHFFAAASHAMHSVWYRSTTGMPHPSQ